MTKNIILSAIMLTLGIGLGYMLFKVDDHSVNDKTSIKEKNTIWTCSMDPQIKQPMPGSCPICGMDLIPLEETGDNSDPNAISMSENAMIIAGITSMKVGIGKGIKQISLNGKVEINEKSVYSQSSHIPGRIEDIKVTFTGEYIKKGQKVASIYSPELVSAQQELLEAIKIKDVQPQVLEAVKTKLKNWKIDNNSIEKIISTGKIQNNFDIYADVSGYIIKKNVELGDYILRGQTLYDVADLSTVWILFEIYESDLNLVKVGNTIKYNIASYPGKEFTGNVSFIDPFINPVSRVAKARIVVSNSNKLLKPEMFVSGIVNTKIKADKGIITIPKSAIMWTGKRSLVYIKNVNDKGVSFKLREVTLGPFLGDEYVIENGLVLGEEIAVNGTFNIDAAAQLAGKPSMMNPEGTVSSLGHNHEDKKGSKANQENIVQVIVSHEIKLKLKPVFDAYFSLKDALTNDDFELSINKGKILDKELDKVNMNIFKDNAHDIWMKNQTNLKRITNHISQTKNIDEFRVSFESISDIIIILANSFHPLGSESFVQFCPMAFDNKGAKWLSKDKNIVNPYFGAKMLKCGKIQQTISEN